MYAWLKHLFSENKKGRDPAYAEQILRVVTAIDAICQHMPDDSTSNKWRKIFDSMKAVLEQMPNEQGIKQATEIWDGMRKGMGSWSDYYIPDDDQARMKQANDELSRLCGLLSLSLQQ